MDKPIDYLDDLSVDLEQLSGLCNVLSSVGESQMEPSWESVGDSFRTIRDMLDCKVAEIDKMVSEWYKSQAGKPAAKP